MKEIIVIIGSVILGVFIFTMIMGDEHSLKKATGEVIKESVEFYFEE